MIDVKTILVDMSPYVQYISFGLLLLAGLNIPVSEDLVFIISASIASTAARENTLFIFAGCFFGAFISDIIAYAIGRYGFGALLSGNALARFKIVNPEKIEAKIGTLKDYFNRYGAKTLFFGRFVPFGFRNAMFMTCGLIRMNIVKFMLIDICALACTSTLLFSLGYAFGNNYELLFPYLSRYKLIIAGIAVAIVIVLIIKREVSKNGRISAEKRGESSGAQKQRIPSK